MPVLFDLDRAAVILDSSEKALTTLEPESVDALVTDPPAGIGFMGKDWDGDKGGRAQWVAWLAGVMRECLRVLKPGAHGLVWALPRTSHWTATALEDAGFEVRDVVMHLFGTGFPKSLSIAKEFEKQGVEQPAYADGTNAQQRFAGFGTALKPAAEHWILVRKPLAGTVARNVAAYGTGGLNIDGCRIESGDKLVRPPVNNGHTTFSGGPLGAGRQDEPGGRWPAHLTLDEEAAALLDAQSLAGGMHSAGKARGKGLAQQTNDGGLFGVGNHDGNGARIGDSGGASRFFYVAKPSPAERDAGCESLPARTGGEATDREDGSAGVDNPRAGAGRGGGRRNFHPTVKPVALMRWLVRLITPPGGVVLDPFTGSGTTGVAALAEGLKFIGIEMSPEYAPIIEARIRKALA